MEPQTSYIKTIELWSEEETNALMDKYKKYISEIGPIRRFKNKKDMWRVISEEITTRTPKQCEERWKTVLKRKKKNHPYENVAPKAKTKAKKKARIIQPEVVEDDEDEDDMITNELVELTNNYSLNRTLLKIAIRTEKAKERRHKEKMAAFNKFSNLIEQLIENK